MLTNFAQIVTVLGLLVCCTVFLCSRRVEIYSTNYEVVFVHFHNKASIRIFQWVD